MTHRQQALLGLAPVVAVAVLAAVLESPSASSTAAGCLHQFRIAGNPGGLAPEIGSSGKVFFAEQLQDRVGRLDPSTGQTTFVRVPTGSMPHYMSAAPDGTLWFSGLGGAVFSMDPTTLAVRTYRRGISPASVPHAVIEAPDGKVYFTEQEAGRLGELDPATGKIIEISAGLPPRNRMHGIAVDPDHEHLWIALENSSALARFSLETQRFDKLVRFPTGLGTHDVRVGPDGHTLFITMQFASKLGTYDLRTGREHVYDAPLPVPQVTDLEVGPKLVDVVPDPRGGAVWISTFAANRLFRFDTSTHRFATLTCGTLPSGSTLEVNTGPGNRLWITEPLPGDIARLDPK